MSRSALTPAAPPAEPIRSGAQQTPGAGGGAIEVTGGVSTGGVGNGGGLFRCIVADVFDFRRPAQRAHILGDDLALAIVEQVLLDRGGRRLESNRLAARAHEVDDTGPVDRETKTA